MYLFFYNFNVQDIPFELGKLKKNYMKGKKIKLKRARSPLLEDANYDLERNELRNILNSMSFKFALFSHKL